MKTRLISIIITVTLGICHITAQVAPVGNINSDNMLANSKMKNATYVAYIEQWRELAEQQEADYGIPACITLAQGLLESSAGQSELALNANNHFGIKCAGDWMGDVYRYDDDAKAECFRVYGNAGESFRDHSIFLQRDRYKSLYEIDKADYAAWAYRLRECGYATDPLYAQKLIKIIEDYNLAPRYVKKKADKGENEEQGGVKKAVIVVEREKFATITQDPEPEYVEPLSAREEKEQLMLSHRKQKENGTYYITAQEGDTYANIAFRLDITERKLREWNDALGRDMKEGDRIYLSIKRTEGAKEKSLLWVHPGESLWMIAQREGVQLKKIQEYNGLPKDVRVFKTRQQISLCKVKQ